MFYGNAEDFKDYCISRGKEINESWSDSKIESALLVSSEWLDNQYEDIWVGYKIDFKQERSWPRQAAVIQKFPYYVYKTDEIPEQVIRATYEAAFRELTSFGSLQVDYTPNKYKSVSVDGAVSVEYASMNYSSDVQKVIPIIQDLMSVLIDDSKNGSMSYISGRAVRK